MEERRFLLEKGREERRADLEGRKFALEERRHASTIKRDEESAQERRVNMQIQSKMLDLLAKLSEK